MEADQKNFEIKLKPFIFYIIIININIYIFLKEYKLYYEIKYLYLINKKLK